MSAEQPMAAPPGGPGKSLTGFYIAIGAVGALFTLGAWLWTPVRVRYIEWGIRRTTPMGGLLPGKEYPHLRLARDLVDIGPPARAAVERLMADQNAYIQSALVRELGRPGATWALPMLVKEVVRDRDAGAWDVLEAVDKICDKRFSQGLLKRTADPKFGFTMTEWTSDASDKLRQRILDWWEREGKAKYGEAAGR
jgi:hypothetical protein